MEETDAYKDSCSFFFFFSLLASEAEQNELKDKRGIRYFFYYHLVLVQCVFVIFLFFCSLRICSNVLFFHLCICVLFFISYLCISVNIFFPPSIYLCPCQYSLHKCHCVL